MENFILAIISFLRGISITAVLAVIVLVWFTYHTYKNHKEFLKEYGMLEFFVVYVRTLGVFISLFLYNFLPYVIHLRGVGLIALCIFIGAAIALGLDVIESKKEETLLEFLWRKFPKSRPQIFSHLILVLAVPFVGIFGIQSQTSYGIILFFGIFMLMVIWVFICQVIDAAVESSKVDENE